jgi:hypothetical protein
MNWRPATRMKFLRGLTFDAFDRVFVAKPGLGGGQGHEGRCPCRFSIPRRHCSSTARLSAPGKPRSPWCSAMLTAAHVSPPLSGMGPEGDWGQEPNAWFQASAQRKIRRMVSRGSWPCAACLGAWQAVSPTTNGP